MKRRHFIGASGLLAVSAITDGYAARIGSRERGKQDSNNESMNISTIAGFTPQELLKKYKQFLFDDFLPFMDRHVVDHEYGGFMCNADRNGNQITTNKRAWFDGRGIWVYATLYNSFGKDPAWLDVAKKTVDFVLKIRPVLKERWPWSYTRLGVGLNESPADIYGDLFIAEGLAEYSIAVNDQKYWDIAKEILVARMKDFDSDTFDYIVDYGPQAPQIPAPRVVGTWMVFMRTSAALLEVKSDPDVERISERSIDALMNKHYVPDFDLIIEVLTHDMKRPEGPFSQFSYTGHAVEVMWMVMHEAIRKHDTALFNLAAKRFKRHVEVAWDDVYGGILRCLENVDKYTWKVDKVCWAQEELLIGTMCLIERTGDPWALHWFEKGFNYVMENYPLQKYGYSLWNIGGDRKMTFVKEGIRIENYHHPRHLMLNIQSLERIIKSGGEVSPLE